MKRKSALIVEDDMGIRNLLKILLEKQNLEVSECFSVKDALNNCKNQCFDLVVLDYHISEEEIGWEIAKQIKTDVSLYGSPKIVAISGTIDIASTLILDYPDIAFDLVFEKPFGAREFGEKISSLFN